MLSNEQTRSDPLAARNAPRPTTYADALALLGNKVTRTIGYNTTLVSDEWDAGTKAIHVRLHNTYIVTFYDFTDSVRVNTGGWVTATTRERMNRYLPEGFQVSLKKRLMYMGLPDGTRVPFQDGYLCTPSAVARFAAPEVTA